MFASEPFLRDFWEAAFLLNAWLPWGEHVSPLRFILRPSAGGDWPLGNKSRGCAKSSKRFEAYPCFHSFFPRVAAPLGRAPLRDMLSCVAEAYRKSLKSLRP